VNTSDNSEKIKMVKEIRIYQCEWLGCGEVYTSWTEADRCQMKGMVAPEIKPGLIFNLKRFDVAPDTSYRVVLHGDDTGHEKTYGLLVILGDLKNPETISVKYEERCSDVLIQFINEGSASLLDEGEFEKVRVVKGEISSKIKTTFANTEEKEHALNNLYREHSYFQK